MDIAEAICDWFSYELYDGLNAEFKTWLDGSLRDEFYFRLHYEPYYTLQEAIQTKLENQPRV